MIRRARASDATALLALMRDLARFEGYDDRFAVSERDLVERGLAPAGPAQFTAFVAEAGAALLGYAVVVEVAFTFDLHPTLVLKELYVDALHRACGVRWGAMHLVQEPSDPWGAIGRPADRLRPEFHRSACPVPRVRPRLGACPCRWASFRSMRTFRG